MVKRGSLLLVLALSLFLPFINAVPTQVFAPYICGEGNNLSCAFSSFSIVNASDDLSTWEAIYTQYSMNDTANRSNLYLLTSTGQKTLLTTLVTGNYPGGFIPVDVGNSPSKWADGFWRAATNEYYYAYSLYYTIGFPGAAIFIKSFSPVTNTTSNLATITQGGYITIIWGVQMRPLNSTHYYVIVSGQTVGNAASFEVWLFDYATNTGTKVSRDPYSFTAYWPLMGGSWWNGTHLQIGWVSQAQHSLIGKTELAVGSFMDSVTLYTPPPAGYAGYAPFPYRRSVVGNVTWVKTLVSNEKDGNREIYVLASNGTGGTFEQRITNTAFAAWNNTLIDLYFTPDKTAIFTYRREDTNQTYSETFCSLFSTVNLSTNCKGFSTSGTSCITGYAWNGSQCIQTNRTALFPTVKMQVYDKACKESLPIYGNPFGNGVFLSCTESFEFLPINFSIGGFTFSYSYNPIEVQDWLYIQYKIDEKYAAPVSWNGSINSMKEQAYAGVSCLVCDRDEINCVTLNDGSPSNPVNYHNPHGTDPNQPYWSIRLQELPQDIVPRDPIFGYLNDPKTIAVICKSNTPDTYVKNYFVLGNTWKYVAEAGDVFKQGYGGAYTDSIIEGQQPWNVRRDITVGMNYPQLPSTGYSDRDVTANCIYELSPITGFGTLNPFMDFLGNTPVGNDFYKSSWKQDPLPLLTIPNTPLPPDNYKATARCYTPFLSTYEVGTVATALYLQASIDGAWRAPSILVQKNFRVDDKCVKLGYAASTLSLQFRSKDGNQRTVFQDGENAYVYATYLNNIGEGVADAVCSLTFINETSGLELDSAAGMHVLGEGVHSQYVQSNALVEDPANGQGINYAQFDLINGTYRVNVTCRNIDPNVCVLPQSASKVFQANVTGVCAGTPDACTLDTCAPCSSSKVICEDGFTQNITDSCISRVCTADTPASSAVCIGHNKWGLQTEMSKSQLPCGDDDTALRIWLLREGIKVPPLSSLPDLSCVGEIEPIAEGKTLNPVMDFRIPVTTGAYVEYDLKGKLDDLRLDHCGQLYNVHTECFSRNFTAGGGLKQADTNFYFGVQGADCRVDNWIVRDTECVYAVSERDADKGKVCNQGNVIDSASVCGCPLGQNANATTNKCEGKANLGGMSDFFKFKWLNAYVAFLILFFVPLVLFAYSVYKGGKPRITIAAPQDRE